MKKVVFLLMAVVLYAEGSRFNLSYSFEKETMADKLVSNIELYFLRDSMREARLVAEQIDISDFDGVCRGGAIAITPEYHYEKGRSTLTGHTSIISLACEFDLAKAEQFSRSVEKLQKKVNDSLGRFYMSAPTRVLSKALKNSVITELENEATAFAIERAAGLKEQFKFKKCLLEQISFAQTSSQLALMINARDSVNEPLDTKERLAINAQIEILCK